MKAINVSCNSHYYEYFQLNDIFITVLERERLEHALTLERCQKENEALQVSNYRLTKELEELREKIPKVDTGIKATNDLIIGAFATDEVRPPHYPCPFTSRIVTFTSPYSTTPDLALGLNILGIVNSQNVGVRAHANNIQNDQFVINLDGWGGRVLPGGRCGWLEIPGDDPDFQCGSFSTLEDHPENEQRIRTTRLINFKRRYSAPPRVVVWLTAFHMDHTKNWCIKAYATHITPTGFTIHIETWGDTVLYSATASWVAHTADKVGVASGSFGTVDMRPAIHPQPYNSGYIEFGKDVFDAPPRILAAISSFDIGCVENLRISMDASAVNATGMTWRINTWDGTVLNSAGASYIALG